jgi:Concanavalin A-like lectin/glucanases superfamily
VSRLGRAPGAALVVALACASCAHGPTGGATAGGATHPARTAAGPDSVTSALWRLDESVGVNAADAGPFRLDGTYGPDTRSAFGRVGRARSFTSSVNSFVYVNANPALDAGAAFSVEAWVFPNDFGDFEDTPIVARWAPEIAQTSWMLSIVARNTRDPDHPGTGDHLPLIRLGTVGKVFFAFQPEAAGTPRSYFSSRPLELGRWTHVAATYDGEVVKIYLDGLVDAQYASPGRVRATTAPLFIGNVFDPRWLTGFGGDLRAGPNADPFPYYAFRGLIDEVRISSVARAEFPAARGR